MSEPSTPTADVEKFACEAADEIQHRLNNKELTPHLLKEIIGANYAHFIAQACAPLVEALEWYRDEARAVAKHKDGNTEALLASFHVLALDNGKRADAALTGTGNKPKV